MKLSNLPGRTRKSAVALTFALTSALTGCAGQHVPTTDQAALTTALVSTQAKGDARDHQVHWPDGKVTAGSDAFAQMFVFAPDVHVVGEPTRSGDGDWTTVVRVVAGTFTAPRSGKENVAPTGKPFKIWFATISHRTPQGVVDGEYAFWSERTLQGQIER